MSYHFCPLPTAADQVRADGWSPARQRHFLETLAAAGVITTACEAAHISPRGLSPRLGRGHPHRPRAPRRRTARPRPHRP